MGTRNPCPDREASFHSNLCLTALRTQQDHSPTVSGKPRPRESGACSGDARTRTGTQALFPGCLAFLSHKSRTSLCGLRKGAPAPLWLSVPAPEEVGSAAPRELPAMSVEA